MSVDTAVSVQTKSLFLKRQEDDWIIAGSDAASFELANEYLAYLSDRNYSPQSVRAYGFALLSFCRWLKSERIRLEAVTTDVLLRYLAACRQARIPGRRGAQCGAPRWSSRRCIRAVDDQSSTGRHLGTVRVPDDAQP